MKIDTKLEQVLADIKLALEGLVEIAENQESRIKNLEDNYESLGGDYIPFEA